MATWNEIEKANRGIKTTDIKGKNYAEVNQRIKAFRKVHPDGSIVTEMVSNENGLCVMRAVVADEDGKVLGTGTAYEKESSSYINKTSYIENCETSAVGRALGICGFGIDAEVASSDEVNNAIQQQEQLMQQDGIPARDKLIYCLKQRNIDIEAYAKEKGLSINTPEETFVKCLMELAKESK